MFLECSGPQWLDVAKLCADRQIDIVYWSALATLLTEVRDLVPGALLQDTADAKMIVPVVDIATPGFDGVCAGVWAKEARLLIDVHAGDESMEHGRRGT